VAGEVSILAVQRYRSDGPFSGAVTDLYAAASQGRAESIPVFGNMANSFAERRLVRRSKTVMRVDTITRFFRSSMATSDR
jgi:hypothetical protein